MRIISEYKDMALESLNNNWGQGALVTFVYILTYCGIIFAIGFFVGVFPSGSEASREALSNTIVNVAGLSLLPLEFGLAANFLNLSRGKGLSISQLFDGFNDYKRIFTTLLLVQIYTVLWALLLFIPGVVKSYSYSMTPFILKDNPTMKNNEAIELSMKLMKGHKMQLFLLDLSMIGWALLCMLTLGLGVLLLQPYNTTAHAAFYRDLINDYDDADGNESFGAEPDFEEVQ
ncbi:MAG: DUF975 family protein [Prevotella sp.]|nr:DUF975 family protein [Prevotella sp.]